MIEHVKLNWGENHSDWRSGTTSPGSPFPSPLSVSTALGPSWASLAAPPAAAGASAAPRRRLLCRQICVSRRLLIPQHRQLLTSVPRPEDLKGLVLLRSTYPRATPAGVFNVHEPMTQEGPTANGALLVGFGFQASLMWDPVSCEFWPPNNWPAQLGYWVPLWLGLSHPTGRWPKLSMVVGRGIQTYSVDDTEVSFQTGRNPNSCPWPLNR